MIIHFLLLRGLTDQFLHRKHLACFNILNQTNKPIATFSYLLDFSDLFTSDTMDGERAEQAEHISNAITHQHITNYHKYILITYIIDLANNTDRNI